MATQQPANGKANPGMVSPAGVVFGVSQPVAVPVSLKPPSQATPIPPRPTLTAQPVAGKLSVSNLWIPAGKPVTVRGYVIPGGLLYLGQTGSHSSSSEPSVIDPTLSVGERASCHDRLMPYWRNYSSVSPEARSAYLEWLSTGKSDPEADIGYVFLYFYARLSG